MKKIVSALLILVLVFTCAFSLVSCMKFLKGTYTEETTGTKYTFDGKGNVTISMTLLGVTTSYDGTYELNDDKTEITVTYSKVSTTSKIEFGDGFILIDDVKLVKEK